MIQCDSGQTNSGSAAVRSASALIAASFGASVNRLAASSTFGSKLKQKAWSPGEVRPALENRKKMAHTERRGTAGESGEDKREFAEQLKRDWEEVDR